ncbi:MAG: caspase family protein [Spirochaetales bacterium]|nr:caspase family protein [Spirochaetales bacterium]
MRSFRITFVIASFLLSVLSIFAEPRNALLIANGNYQNFSGLANPIPEANALGESLRKLGFTVRVESDLSYSEMQMCLMDFEMKVKKSGGIAFFHYGGHAVQVGGENYLIPADADIPSERLAKSRALNLDEVMTSMCGDTNIVVLDACRNNPLPAGDGRSASRGLVPISRKPKNSLIVYSAQAGSTAQDGVFTPILTEKILEPKSFTAIVREVRKEVNRQTNNQQNPGSYEELEDEIYLSDSAAVSDTITVKKDNDYKKDSYKEEIKSKQSKTLSSWDILTRKRAGGSLVGVGSAVITFSLVFIPVGAANAVDCVARNFTLGSDISFAFLGVGIGLAVTSIAMIASGGGLLYTVSHNNDIRNNTKYYRYSGLSHRKRVLMTLCNMTFCTGYNIDTEQMSVGVGIKL